MFFENSLLQFIIFVNHLFFLMRGLSIKALNESIGEMLEDCPVKIKNRKSFRGLTIEERQLERKARIKNAALELYGTKGFFSVKVKDICLEAGLTERYFYESFKNADALFKCVYESLSRRLRQKILQAVFVASPDVMAMARDGLYAFFSEIQNDGRMARILFIDALQVSSVSTTSIHDALSQFDIEVKRYIEEKYPKMQISPIGLLTIAGLNGYATTLCLRWVRNGFDSKIEDLLAACILVYTPLIERAQQKDNPLLIYNISSQP